MITHPSCISENDMLVFIGPECRKKVPVNFIVDLSGK